MEPEHTASFKSLGRSKFAYDMQRVEEFFATHRHTEIPENYRMPDDNYPIGKRVKEYKRKLRLHQEGISTSLKPKEIQFMKESGLVEVKTRPDTVAMTVVLKRMKKFKDNNNGSTDVMDPEANWFGFAAKDKELLKASYRHVMGMQKMGKERITALNNLGIFWSADPPQEPPPLSTANIHEHYGHSMISATSMRLSNSAEEGNREDSTTNNEEEDYKNRVMKMTVKELKAERRRRGIPHDGIYLKNDIQNQILNQSHSV